jgi:rhodanese-related sulfurtransferase
MARALGGNCLRPAFISLTLVGSVLLPFSAFADGESDGNRYYLERYYQGEISASQAFLEAVVKKGKWADRSDKLIILDVRDATEYKLGHPEGAYHFPYPRIYRKCIDNQRSEDGGSCTIGQDGPTVLQDPEDLFLMVEEKFPDKSQRLATLCRTGYRSVLVANILSKPEKVICDQKYSGDAGAHAACETEYADRGYSRVSNIWQGFVGQPKAGTYEGGGALYVVGADQTLTDLTLADGTTAKGFVAYDLDLNKDDDITAADKDGWRYFQGMPYDTRLLKQLKNRAVTDLGYYDMP